MADWISRENIETAGIIASILGAAWAVLNSRSMTIEARKANQIAGDAAAAARHTAESSIESVKLQKQQWEDARSASFRVTDAHTILEPSGDGSLEVTFFNASVMNRGNVVASDVRERWEVLEGETWRQVKEVRRSDWGVFHPQTPSPELSAAEYNHYSGLKLVVNYTDFTVHEDVFIFSRRPRGSGDFELVSATHDGDDHPQHPRLHESQ